MPQLDTAAIEARLAAATRSIAGALEASAHAPTDIRALLDEVARLRAALTRLRDCDWVITPHDRMDAVRDIARKALGGGE